MVPPNDNKKPTLQLQHRRADIYEWAWSRSTLLLELYKNQVYIEGIRFAWESYSCLEAVVAWQHLNFILGNLSDRAFVQTPCVHT
jgi:hypothetical protein